MNPFAQARFLTSAAAPGQFPRDLGAEVAFAGRSNAGKSSAINALCGQRTLARTSKTPGRTRLLNFFEVAPDRRIVDLPGYGYATASEAERASWVPMVEALARRDSLRALFLIVDARRGLLPGDIELLEWAQAARRDVEVLLSKADTLGRAQQQKTLKESTVRLAGKAGAMLFSAHSGEGVEAARRLLARYLNKITPAAQIGGGPPGQTDPDRS